MRTTKQLERLRGRLEGLTYARLFREALRDFQCLRRLQEMNSTDKVAPHHAMFQGEYRPIPVEPGHCVCVTCGATKPWRGRGGIQGGHFVGRTYRPTALHPMNVHPQCIGCNRHGNGRWPDYYLYLQSRYGKDVPDTLIRSGVLLAPVPRMELIDKVIFNKTFVKDLISANGN